MTTRIEIRTRLRDELGDMSAQPVWSTALLNGYLDQALLELSRELPPVREFSIAGVNGQRDYPLDGAGVALGPGGLKKVSFPGGEVVRPGDTAEGDPQAGGRESYEQRWELMSGASGGPVLRFRYPLRAGGSIVVQGWGRYTLGVADGSVLDLPGYDENLLVWLAAMLAHGWLEQQRGKRVGPVPTSMRGSAEYYGRLYGAGLTARRRAGGIKTGQVVRYG